MSALATTRDSRAPAPLAALLVYESGDRCQGCGGRSWNVGRVSAECARCGLVQPLSASFEVSLTPE